MSEASPTSGNTPYVSDITLDCSSPVPLYFQISEPVAQLINSDALPAYMRLEDELSMVVRLHVSRPMVRQALQRLVNRGLLTRRHGVSTVVSPRHVHHPMELTFLVRDLVNTGHKVHIAIQHYEARPASAQEADVLKIIEGTFIVHIEHTCFANDEPVTMLTNSIPTDIAPTTQGLGSASLYDLMHKRRVTLASARQVIGARSATTKKARPLFKHHGAVLLMTQRTTYDPSGHIVEYGNHIYRASRYSFETNLFAQ